MKKITKGLAVVCAAASLLALGGCAKKTPNNRVTTLANWNVNTATVVEENMKEYWQTHEEVATYSISFKEGANSTYKVVYNASAEGTGYTTKFRMETYDWASTEIPEAYRSTEADSEPVYVFETSLKLSGYFQIKPEGATKEFEDETTSITYFRLASNNLQPVYSHVKSHNTAPAELNATNIDAAYVQIDEEYHTYYNKKCTQATVYKTNYLEKDNKQTTKKIGISGKDGYSVFDNSQLVAAVRSFNLSGGATRTFKVLVPQNNSVHTFHATITSPIELK
ncbi:MAG: hypothetical protein K2K39_03035, partial [Clostridia bacterium]|nr:hypothetical protein [Clostridia bacterium]